MNNSKLINEVFWLRCIACIAVTFGHAIQKGYIHYTDPSLHQMGSYILYMGVLFGVPVFVFISEFLLSNKYVNKVPPGFIKKRLKILLVPYIFMSFVFALFEVKTWAIQNLLIEISRNIFLGESTVYFILIIFQFYLLHILFSKHLNRLSPKVVISAAFIINIAYLGFFNFVEAPSNTFAQYFWNPGYWMPFVGWIFYFVLGYYCGKNYQTVLGVVRKYNKLVLIMPFVTLIGVFLMNKYYLIGQSSKRIDILLYATAMIFLIMYIASMAKKTPKLIMIISNYSFSIFLLNEFFFLLFSNVEPPAFMNILSYSLTVFFLSLLSSIGLANVLNKIILGKYLVGKVMEFRVDNRQQIIRSTNLSKMMEG